MKGGGTLANGNAAHVLGVEEAIALVLMLATRAGGVSVVAVSHARISETHSRLKEILFYRKDRKRNHTDKMG